MVGQGRVPRPLVVLTGEFSSGVTNTPTSTAVLRITTGNQRTSVTTHGEFGNRLTSVDAPTVAEKVYEYGRVDASPGHTLTMPAEPKSITMIDDVGEEEGVEREDCCPRSGTDPGGSK